MVPEIIIKLVCSALMMSGYSNALPTSMEKMTVSRMRMADLESSATGYAYNSQQGRPASYVQYTNHGTGGFYDAPAPIQYVTYRKPQTVLNSGPAVIAAAPVYKHPVAAPGYVIPLLASPKSRPLAPYYVPAKVDQKPQQIEIQDDYDLDEHDESNGESDEEDGDEEEEGHGDHEESGGGEESNAEEHSSHGEKGEEGYKSRHEVDNAEKGKYNKENHEGHYNDEDSNTKSHGEASGRYGQHDEAENSNEGESFSQQAYHKKGHKTTGFHNVYRKDEYKKDTDFYDENHKSGDYDKHSSSDAHHSVSDGAFKKGGQHDSGYEKHQKGDAGHYDKGREQSQHKGYKKEEGANSYHKNDADYSSKSGAEGNKKYGYSDGH